MLTIILLTKGATYFPIDIHHEHSYLLRLIYSFFWQEQAGRGVPKKLEYSFF